MKWGKQEEFLREMAKDTGVVPPGLASKPALSRSNAGVLDVFNMLSQSRQWGMEAPQAILMSEILAYLEIAQVDEVEDRLRFTRIVKTLDLMYLNHCAEQKKK